MLNFAIWLFSILIVFFFSWLLSGAETTGALGGYLGFAVFGEGASSWGGIGREEVLQIFTEECSKEGFIGQQLRECAFAETDSYFVSQYMQLLQVIIVIFLVRTFIKWLLINIFHFEILKKPAN